MALQSLEKIRTCKTMKKNFNCTGGQPKYWRKKWCLLQDPSVNISIEFVNKTLFCWLALTFLMFFFTLYFLFVIHLKQSHTNLFSFNSILIVLFAIFFHIKQLFYNQHFFKKFILSNWEKRENKTSSKDKPNVFPPIRHSKLDKFTIFCFKYLNPT